MTKKTSKDAISNKQVFTTGEAARICNVSQQTIIRCFDSGRLHGFKVPGSRFRRIPRAELIRFMQHNKMDMNRLGEGPIQVLVVGLSAEEVDSVIQTHSAGKEIEIQHADDVWTAGFLAHKCNPGLILLSPAMAVNKSSILATLSVSNRHPGRGVFVFHPLTFERPEAHMPDADDHHQHDLVAHEHLQNPVHPEMLEGLC